MQCRCGIRENSEFFFLKKKGVSNSGVFAQLSGLFISREKRHGPRKRAKTNEWSGRPKLTT